MAPRPFAAKIVAGIGTNAGAPRQLPVRTRWVAEVPLWRRFAPETKVRMKKTTLNRSPMTVDGKPYEASLNATYPDDSGPIAIRVTIRADYGHRSVCIFRGFTNLEYWFNYGEYDPEKVIAITPRVIADLIRFAHTQGWDPDRSKSNVEIEADNSVIRQLMEKNT
jgi:hypothetical protein